MKEKKPVSQTRTKLYLRTLIIVFFDIVTLALSGFVALWVRFDFSINQIPANFLETQIRMTPMVVVTFLVIYYLCKLYHSVWRFASVSELSRIVLAYVIIIPVFAVEHVLSGLHMPRSTYLIAYVLDFLCCVAIRFSYRIFRYWVNRRGRRGRTTPSGSWSSGPAARPGNSWRISLFPSTYGTRWFALLMIM